MGFNSGFKGLTGIVVMHFVNKDWSEDSTKNVAEYECNKHTHYKINI